MGVPRIRIIVFWGLYGDTLILGNHHLWFGIPKWNSQKDAPLLHWRDYDIMRGPRVLESKSEAQAKQRQKGARLEDAGFLQAQIHNL